MNISFLKTIIISLITLILFGGCVREELVDPKIDGSAGKRVSVSLTFSIPPLQNPELGTKTRSIESNAPFSVFFDSIPAQTATRSDGKTELYNLWVFQFNIDGSRNGEPTQISNAVTAVNDMVTLDVPLTVAENQTLYLIALGPKLTTDLSSVRTKADLEAWEFAYTTSLGGGTKSAITDETEIPFAGTVSGVKVLEIDGSKYGLVEYNTPNGFVGSIPIKRLMAKIALRYKFDVPDYKLEGLKLVNATNMIRIINPENNDADSYVTLDPELSQPDANGYITATWYVTQNRPKIENIILSESDRFYKVINNVSTGKAPPLGSFIEAWAYKNSNADNYAIYQMYIGRNNTSDFDVLSNSIYNLNTTINTDIESASNDGRIREYSAIQKIYLVSSKIIKWAGDNEPKSGDKYDIDAHPDWRPIIIDTKGTTVTIGIYSDESCLDNVNVNDSWLKISSSPNYTEAINNRSEPLTTLLTTQTILPVRLKFYLYCDEYLPSPTDDLSETEPLLPKKRTLYVKAVTTRITEKGVIEVSSGIFKMAQHRGVYIGAFGGEVKDGTFTDALFIDNIEESSLSYTEETIKDPTNNMPWGYQGVKFPTESPVWNTYSGIKATQYLAENVVNENVGAPNIKEPRRLANGKIDLYQYNYANTYASRFCYDRNRDDDGNGQIDHRPGQPNNELKWYTPAIRQLMSFQIFHPLFNAGLGRAIWSTSPAIHGIYAGSSSGTTEWKQRFDGYSARCVREVPFNKLSVKKAPQVYIYTDERGNKYAGINSSDQLRRVEVRNNNINFWKHGIGLYYYAVDGNNAKPVLDADNNQILVTRPRRTSNFLLNNLMSSNFILASVDMLNTTSAAPTKTMNWATAAGYLETANTTKYDVDASAVEHGCASYTGKDNKDTPGTWRLPLIREAMLIMIYENALLSTASETKFEELEDSIYWTAAEDTFGSKSWYFWPIRSKSTWWVIETKEEARKTNSRYARCIRDIPPIT